MELFSLLAKLTLDSKEFDKGIDEAEKKGNFTIEDAKLGLDKSEFDDKVEDAQNTQVSDLDKPELGLDTDEFDQNIKKAEEDSGTYTKSIGKMFGDLKGIIAGAGIITVLGSINKFLKEGINLASDHADTIDKDSGALGISYQYYQKLEYMMSHSGGTVNELKNGFIVFRKVLGASDEEIKAIVDSGGDLTGELEECAEKSTDAEVALKSFLNSRGYNISDFESIEDMMDTTFDLLAQISDQTERETIIDSIFGAKRSGVVKNLLKEGKEALDELKSIPVEKGFFMTDEEVKNGVKYKDTVEDFHREMNALKEVFVADILPVLTDALKFITSILAFFNPRANRNGLADMLEDVDKDFANNIRNIDTMEGEAMSLVDQMSKMGEYSSLSAEGQEKWNQMADKAIELFPQLSEVIDKDSHKLKANTDEIKENIRQYGNMLKKRAMADALDEREAVLAEKAKEAAYAEYAAADKRNEAEGKRYAAIKEANRIIKENKNNKADTYIRNQLGKELAEEDFYYDKKADRYYLKETASVATLKRLDTALGGGFNAVDTSALQQMTVDYEKLNGEAEGLLQTSKDLDNQLKEEEEKNKRYTQIAYEKYGIMTDEQEEAIDKAKELVKVLGDLPKTVFIDIQIPDIAGIFSNAVSAAGGYPQAIGDPYVPYDNYPSLLHRGEMVLTATEARKYREGGGDSSDLEDRIIEAIQRGMSNAHVDAFMDGEKVTRSVSNRLARENGARRYNP